MLLFLVIGRAGCEADCQQNDANYVITSVFLTDPFIVYLLVFNVVIRSDVFLLYSSWRKTYIFFSTCYFVTVYNTFLLNICVYICKYSYILKWATKVSILHLKMAALLSSCNSVAVHWCNLSFFQPLTPLQSQTVSICSRSVASELQNMWLEVPPVCYTQNLVMGKRKDHIGKAKKNLWLI